MSKINLTFKGKKYEIDKSLLGGAITSLEGAFEVLEQYVPETKMLAPGLYETGAIALYEAGDYDAASAMLTSSWDALEANGVIAISEGEDIELPEMNEYGFYYGVPYVVNIEGMTVSFTFNEDSSVIFDQAGEIIEIPAGATIYGDHSIDMSATLGMVLGVSPDGTQIGADGLILAVGSGLPPKGAVYLPTATLIEGDLVLPNDGRATSLPSGAFFEQTALTGIILPDSITFITPSTFSYCDNLTSVVIGNSVTTIDNYAFDGCYKLANMVIPGSVTTIGHYAFRNCYELTSVDIPDSVTTIGEYAFHDCSKLTSVVIPDSVTTIGSYAFSGCYKLISVTISDSVTSISKGAFSDCRGLTSVVIPDSVTTIESNAFSYCDNLTNVVIPDSVTTIDSWAFSRCLGLTSVVIPDSVTTIGAGAFDNCTNLKNVYITDVAAWCDISLGSKWANPLCYATKLYLNGELITELVIPDGVTTVPAYAFYGVSNITSIVIPDSVTSIGDSAFYNCSGLTSVVIGNSVTEIGPSAFSSCSGLTSVVIPDSVIKIGYNAFYSCAELKDVYITDAIAWCNVSFGNTTSNPLYYATNLYLNGELMTEFVIPEGVTTISSMEALQPFNKLERVVIPTSVTSISEKAFSDCSGLKDLCFTGTVEQWLAVSKSENWNYGILLEYVHCIDGKVYMDNTVVYDGTIEPGLYDVDNNLVASWYALSNKHKLAIDKDYVTSTPLSPDPADYKYSNVGSGYKVLVGDLAKGVKLIVPGSVTNIGAYALAECYGLTEVVLNEGITSIGCNSFYLCENIATIKLPDSLISIDEGAFKGCYSLDNVEIPNSVTDLGESAFYMCTSLTSVVIPDSLTTIPAAAFYTCNSLVNIDLPNSIISIGRGAFAACKGLTGILIPNSVISIGNSAFSGCNALLEVAFEEGCSVTSLGDYAFDRCVNLVSFVIPANVTTINKNTFVGCSNLKSVVIPAGIIQLTTFAFDGCTALTDITFEGTIAQWNNITKQEDWARNVPATYVQCSDGQVAL